MPDQKRPQLIAVDPSSLNVIHVVDFSLEEGASTEAVGLMFDAPFSDSNIAFLLTLDGDQVKLGRLKQYLEELLEFIAEGGELEDGKCS